MCPMAARWDIFPQDVYKLSRLKKSRLSHLVGRSINPQRIVGFVSDCFFSWPVGTFYFHSETNTSQWTDPRLDVKPTASDPQTIAPNPPAQPPPPPRPRNQGSIGEAKGPPVLRANSNPETLVKPPVIGPSIRPQSERPRVPPPCLSPSLSVSSL
jgi:hypothetical protein